MRSDTESLVSEASQGSLPAVEELLARNLPALRAFLRLRAGPAVRAHEQSGDLVQSVCREVLENLSGFRYGGEAGFRNWLFTAALRKLDDRGRHWQAGKRDAARDVRCDEELLEGYRQMTSPSEHAIAREQAGRLEAAFDALDEDDRELITLARLVGLSHAEIAAQRGCSEGAARVALHRALARLARRLDPEAGPGGG